MLQHGAQRPENFSRFRDGPVIDVGSSPNDEKLKGKRGCLGLIVLGRADYLLMREWLRVASRHIDLFRQEYLWGR